MTNSVYYVYHYLREDGSPYYVGKGKDQRVFKPHNVPVPPADRIRFVAVDLTEELAHCIEKEHIALLGRKNNGTGILRNLTDGGEGTSGYNHSVATKTKIKNIKTGIKRKPFSSEHIENMRFAQADRSDETRKRMSDSRKGKPKTPEHRAKISESNKGRMVSNDTREKIRNANVGKKMSDETKEKLRMAAIKRREEKNERAFKD